MPIQVDVDKRRREIAEASLRVAARAGLAGVTLRSVADEMGASTTVITNYLPTRTDLLVNAIDWLGDEWFDELQAARARYGGSDALMSVMEAAVRWNEDELLRCQFWVAVLSAPARTADVDAHLADAAERIRRVLAEMCRDAGHPAPDEAADLLFLYAQGVFVSIVEASEQWPPERAVAGARGLVEMVLSQAR